MPVIANPLREMSRRPLIGELWNSIQACSLVSTFGTGKLEKAPGWVDGRPVPSDLYSSPDRAAVTIRVNGESVDNVRDNGYCVVELTWSPGDRVVLELSMPVQRVHAHPRIEDDRERVALMRGPLLYCFGEADLGTDPEAVVVPPTTRFTAAHRPGFLGGVTGLYGDAGELQAVPFAVWNNRKPGRMAAWMKGKE